MKVKNLKKKLIAGIACVATSFMGMGTFMSYSNKVDAEETKKYDIATIEDTIKKAYDSYLDNAKGLDGKGYMDSSVFLQGASTTDTDWAAFSINRFGKLNAEGKYEHLYEDGHRNGGTTNEANVAYREALRKYFVEKYDAGSPLHRVKATEWHRGAMAYLAVGGDPTAISYTDTSKGTFDLIEDGSYNCVASKGPGGQGINGWIWGLLSMDYIDVEVPQNAKYSRTDFIQEILADQLYDLEEMKYTGFSLSGNKPDGDITGMALTALAPYYNDEEVYTYINSNTHEERTVTVRDVYDEAIMALPDLMTESGALMSWNAVNVETTVWAMLPLVGIGIDPVSDSRFITSKGKSFIDGIMNFNLPQGGFCHTYEAGDDGFNNGGGQWNNMANDQATYSLVGYWRFLNGERALFDMRPEFTVEEKANIKKAMDDIDSAMALEGQAGYEEALNKAQASYNVVKAVKNQRYVYNYYKLSDALEKQGKVVKVEIASAPTKTVYEEGELFTPNGMTFKTINDKGVVRVLENPEIVVVNNDPLTVNDNYVVKLKVNGNDLETTVKVTPKKQGMYTVSVEAFTIGGGYIIEPTLYTNFAGDTVKTVLENALSMNGFAYDLKENGMINTIYNGDKQGAGIVSPKADAQGLKVKSTATYPVALDTLIKELNFTPNLTKPVHGVNQVGAIEYVAGLGEKDFSNTATWMIRINDQLIDANNFATVSNQAIKDGDTVRLQFSILNGGEDIGKGTLNNTNTDNIVEKLALINYRGTKFSYGWSTRSKIEAAKKLMYALDSTQEALDTAYNDLMSVVETNMVSFDGRSAPAQKVPYGECATKPADPTKQTAQYNYKFMGWYYGNQLYDFGTPVTSKITLIPRFVKDGLREYTVTFKNGDEVLSEVKAVYGTAVTAPQDPTKTGYTFAGWDTTFDNITKDTVVNATWTINTYNVTFKNGEEVILEVKADYGTAATAPENPTKTGYTFAGWDKAFDNVTEDIVVNATWTINTYTVTFKNGDEVLLEVKADYGTAVTAPENPTKTGYTFAGWDRAFDNVTEDIVVNATWTINTYTVTFKNGDEVLSEVKVDFGTAVTAPENPTKTGYTFAGWDKAFDNVTEDIVVNATWTINTYKVTFKSGDEILLEVTVEYGKGATAPVEFTKKGFKFDGWDTAFDNVTGDLVVNAKWVKSSGCDSSLNSATIIAAFAAVTTLAFVLNKRK